MKNLNRSKKCIKRDIKDLEARLANGSNIGGLDLQAREMDQEIDEQKMVDLLNSYSQSLKERTGHTSAVYKEREHQQIGQKWRDSTIRAQLIQTCKIERMLFTKFSGEPECFDAFLKAHKRFDGDTQAGKANQSLPQEAEQLIPGISSEEQAWQELDLKYGNRGVTILRTINKEV